MGQVTVGDVVTISFPFSDLKGSKVRPALVVALAEFENIILCQITSRAYSSSLAIRLDKRDFSSGKLPLTSYVRPDKLFTADPSIVLKKVGWLTPTKRDQVLMAIRALFTV